MTLSYLTINDVAARLGVSPSLVRRRAKLRGVGIQPTARIRLFVEADVDRLKPREPGQPGHAKRFTFPNGATIEVVETNEPPFRGLDQ